MSTNRTFCCYLMAALVLWGSLSTSFYLKSPNKKTDLALDYVYDEGLDELKEESKELTDEQEVDLYHRGVNAKLRKQKSVNSGATGLTVGSKWFSARNVAEPQGPPAKICS